MTAKYLRVKRTRAVARIIPETNHCWSLAGFVFARMANTGESKILDLPDIEYITEREYFKGCLGG